MRRLIALGALPFLLAAKPAKPTAERPYTTWKLDTGLTVVALEDHKVPLDTIVLSCKAGAMTESPEINGLTHLWEHMFFKGNQRLPNQEAFNKRIRQLGIEFNGDTAAEKVRYYFTLPSAFLDEGLQFMSDAISHPLLEQKELERERRVVQDEYDRAAAQPSFDETNLVRNYIYGKQEYLRDPLGLRPIIDKATRQQLLVIKDQVFVPSNCALLVGGDLKPAELKPMIAKYYSEWKDPKAWKPVTPPPFPKFPKTTAFVMTRPNVENAHISVTLAGPKARTQPKESYAADVLVNLVEHKSGNFFKKFIDSGMAYEAGLGYYTQSQAGEIELYATTTPETAVKLEGELLAEANLMAKPGYFTEQQLEDVRRHLKINHKRELNQPTEFIKTLAFWWPVTGLDYYDSYIPNMEKVTLADVRAFVKKWLINKPHVDAILMSPADAKKVGLVDTSGPLVDKYLSMYKKPQQPAAPQAAPSKG